MGLEAAEVKLFPGVLDVFTEDGIVYFMQADNRGMTHKVLEIQAFRVKFLIATLQQCLLQAEADGRLVNE